MATDIEQVIAKVEKLLALGTSSNEHEAALAVAKAQEIILAHGLRMEQIGQKATRSDVRETEAFDVFEIGKTTAWKMDVLEAVARTSNVWIARSRRYERVESKHAAFGTRMAVHQTAYFIGLPMDVEMAGYAFAFLTGEITRLAGEYAQSQWDAISDSAKRNGISIHDAESQHVAYGGVHPLKAKVSFAKGAAHGVGQMLREEAAKRTAADPDTAALVINHDELIRDYWYQKQHGMSYAEYMAHIKERIAADQNPNAVAKPLTEAQARRERERSERAYERARRADEARERRKWANVEMGAYYAGRAAGRQMSIRRGVGGAKAGAERRIAEGE